MCRVPSGHYNVAAQAGCQCVRFFNGSVVFCPFPLRRPLYLSIYRCAVRGCVRRMPDSLRFHSNRGSLCGCCSAGPCLPCANERDLHSAGFGVHSSSLGVRLGPAAGPAKKMAAVRPFGSGRAWLICCLAHLSSADAHCFRPIFLHKRVWPVFSKNIRRAEWNRPCDGQRSGNV